MSLSEKSARRIDQYTRYLVRRLPLWVRELFEEERVVFVIEQDGSLALSVDESLDSQKKSKIASLISKFIEKHPCDVISIMKVH